LPSYHKIELQTQKLTMMEIKRPFQQDCLKPSEDVTVSDLQYLSQMILADQKAAVNGGMRKKIRKKKFFSGFKKGLSFYSNEVY